MMEKQRSGEKRPPGLEGEPSTSTKVRRSTRIAEKRRRDAETEEAQEEEEQAARGTIELGSKEKFEGCVYDDLNGSHRRLADSAGPGTRGPNGRRACDPFAPATRTRVAGASGARPVMRDERTIAYVQPTSSPPYYDDLTGEMLDTARAEEAMQKERNSLNEFKTYEVIAPPLRRRHGRTRRL